MRIKSISDVVTNSSSEVFVKKLTREQLRTLKLERKNNIIAYKTKYPEDDPEYWEDLDSAGVELTEVTKEYILESQEWEIVIQVLREDKNPKKRFSPFFNVDESDIDYEKLIEENDALLQEVLYGAYKVEVSDHIQDTYKKVLTMMGFPEGYVSFDKPEFPDDLLYYECLH